MSATRSGKRASPIHLRVLWQINQCGHCRKVFRGGYSDYKNKKTPCCGKTGKIHYLWPSDGPSKYYELSLKYGLNARYPDNCHIAIVMLSVAAEAMLEELLWALLWKVGSTRQLAEVVMDQAQGRHKMLNLFDSLSPVKARTVFKNHATLANFMQDWDATAQLRNEVAHGKRHYYKGTDPKTGKPLKLLEPVQRFRDQLLDGFMALNNSMY